jgi:membrane-associated phospholipid phosphatase
MRPSNYNRIIHAALAVVELVFLAILTISSSLRRLRQTGLLAGLLSLMFASGAAATENTPPPLELRSELKRVGAQLNRGQSLFWIAAGLGAVAVTQPLDETARYRFSQGRLLSAEASKLGDLAGMGFLQVGIAVAQLAGFDREGGWYHAEALVGSTLTTWLLKRASGRARPNSENKESMPSGHTSVSAATATAIWCRYGWKWGSVAATAASFVALSRMADDAHWLSDTVGGAAVGVFWGIRTSPEEPIASATRWMFGPTILADETDSAPGMLLTAFF